MSIREPLLVLSTDLFQSSIMRRFLIPVLFALVSFSCQSVPHQSTTHDSQSAAVASAHPLATQAGLDILRMGGNAFDAAVAVSATLAVVEPYSSGMGGGGFWLLQRTGDKRAVVIDGREVAPLKAHRDMYLDKQGEVIPGLSINGPLAAGIPGQPAALVHIAKHYGRLDLRTSLAPAIRVARSGFPVTPHYRRMAGFRLQALRASVDASRIFLQDQNVPELGYRVVQPELAVTLERIAQHGRAGFYSGAVARQLVKGIDAAGGIWSLADLANYQVKERQPLIGEYRGYRIVTVPPPSSGGVALLSMLNMLSLLDWHEQKPHLQTHLLVEAMRRAYRDRALYLGDSDFVDVPVARLTSVAHAKKLIADIDPDKASASEVLNDDGRDAAGNHTTHFSIIDRQGNRVSATLSINYPFGSGFVVPGTGILLNDEMDDFSAKPGVPNAYGLIGAEANAIQPGKRMLSSMSPTIIEDENTLALIGTPGGSRIITMVLEGILGVVAGQDAQAIVAQPRFHHQYLPDYIQFEPGAFGSALVEDLEGRGHRLQALESTYGNMQLILVNKPSGRLTAASDPRGEGAARVE